MLPCGADTPTRRVIAQERSSRSEITRSRGCPASSCTAILQCSGVAASMVTGRQILPAHTLCLLPTDWPDTRQTGRGQKHAAARSSHVRRETGRRTVAEHANSQYRLGQIRSLQIGRCEAASRGASVAAPRPLSVSGVCSSSRQHVLKGASCCSASTPRCSAGTPALAEAGRRPVT